MAKKLCKMLEERLETLKINKILTQWDKRRKIHYRKKIKFCF